MENGVRIRRRKFGRGISNGKCERPMGMESSDRRQEQNIETGIETKKQNISLNQ